VARNGGTQWLSQWPPWKHPKTGMHWLRKRVPGDLQSLFGKRKEKVTLKTRDPAEAKRRPSRRSNNAGLISARRCAS
jgi:hypothetical protein